MVAAASGGRKPPVAIKGDSRSQPNRGLTPPRSPNLRPHDGLLRPQPHGGRTPHAVNDECPTNAPPMTKGRRRRPPPSSLVGHSSGIRHLSKSLVGHWS